MSQELDRLIKLIKQGNEIDLECSRVKNIKLDKVKDINCEEYEDMLIDMDELSNIILTLSSDKLLSIYKCWRENDEFWERVETWDIDIITLNVLRLISVVYELNHKSSLAYNSLLFLRKGLDISLDDLMSAIKKNIKHKDIVRVLIEIYAINLTRYRRDDSTLEPPELLYQKYLDNNIFF